MKPCPLHHVRLENLTVQRGREVLVDDVSLPLECGQLTALIGVNGAGKTTLIRAMLGEIPHNGRISYIDHEGRAMARPRIGYVPQRLDFDRSMPLTVWDLLQAMTSRRPVWLGRPASARAAAQAVLAPMQVDGLLERRVGALSGGELQRVLLALALAPLPDLLILDEPVSGVDSAGLDIFYQQLDTLRRDHHMTILLVTHDMAMVRRYADRVALMHSRLLCYGPPAQVLADPAFTDIFGEVV